MDPQLVKDLGPLGIILVHEVTSHVPPPGLVASFARRSSLQHGGSLPSSRQCWKILDRLKARVLSGLLRLMKNFPLSPDQHWVKF